MKRKNPWWGIECQHCEQIYDEKYIDDPHYGMSNGYADLKNHLYWECGRCVKARQEKAQADIKEAMSDKKGAFSSDRTFW